MVITDDINVVRSEFRKSNTVYVFVASFLYAALCSIQFVRELSYQFDRYRQLNPVAAWVFVWIFGTTYAALRIDWKRTRAGHQNGLILSVLTVLLSAILLLVFLRPLLPDVPVVEAHFQTFTARGAYLKDILYALGLPILFVLPTFHFVVLMQSDIEGGRRQRVSTILIDGHSSESRPYGIYPKIWFLLLFLILLLLYTLIARVHLLDNLMPSPYMNLFVSLLHVGQILFFGLAIFGLVRYYRSIETLKLYSKIPLNLVSVASTAPAARTSKKDSPFRLVLNDVNHSLGDLWEEYESSVRRSGRCLAMATFPVRVAHALPAFLFRSIVTIFRK